MNVPLTRRVALASLVFAALVGCAGFAVARSVQSRDMAMSSVHRLTKASLDARRLESSLSEQETGLTEYLETHNPALLERYQVGMSDEALAAAEMHNDLAGRPELLADLDGVETAAAAWRQSEGASVHLGSLPSPGPGRVVATAVLTSLGVTPDIVDTRLSVLARETEVALAAARADANEAGADLSHLTLGALGLIAVLLVGLDLLVRHWTVTPLLVVGRAIREIGSGGTDTPIRVAGPREVVALGAAVEEMRVRERARAAELARAEAFGRITAQVGRGLAAAGTDENAAVEAVANSLVGTLADLCVITGVLVDGRLGTMAVRASDRELARRAEELGGADAALLTETVAAALAARPTTRLTARPTPRLATADTRTGASLLAALGVDQAVLVALRGTDEVLGCLSLFRVGPVGFDEAEVALVTDVAERAAAVLDAGRLHWTLAAGEARLRLALERSPLPAALVRMDDRSGRLRWVNEAFAAQFGYPPGRLTTMRLSDLLYPDDRGAGAALVQRAAGDAVGRQRAELRYQRGDGGILWLTVGLCRISGDGSVYLAQVEATGRRPPTDAEPTSDGLHDPLTDLPNRHLLRDHLGLALDQLGRQGGLVAALYIDLDHFGPVTAAAGRAGGDAVLSEVAARLRDCVRAPDTVGRLGGDEFGVICTGITEVADVTAVADRILVALRRPLDVLGNKLTLTASIGIATTRSPGENPDDLIRRGAAALATVKRSGGNRWLIDRATGATGAARATGPAAVYADLRQALQSGWLRLHYQPVVDLRDGRFVGAEALLRIEHPDRGLVLPSSFIDVAEDSDLAPRLGEWVLEEACGQAALWAGHRPFRTAVNLSARQIGHPQLAATVLAIARDAGVDPSAMALEMTERILIDGGDAVVQELRRLTSAGISLAIDDFGTGYSSLGYLRRFPVDTLKIDKSFVAGVGSGDSDTAIVAALVNLSSTLGLVAIAEGVETENQRARLADLGCPLAQGYHFGRPQPAEAISALLDPRSPGTGP